MSLHPPRPRLTLNVGITGHRATALGAGILASLGKTIDGVLEDLSKAVGVFKQETQAFFSEEPAQLRFHTALATGADQIAAQSARRAGYNVRAILPFPQDEYARDFDAAGQQAEFRKHVALADEVLSLPGQRANENDAYVLVGKAIIAAADVVVAVWDGQEGRGRGGTAHVVELSLKAGVPVIHVWIDRENDAISSVRLLTGGESMDPEVEPLGCLDDYCKILRGTLAPHTQIEQEHLAEYYAEVERRYNWRIEYPALLACLRIRSLPRRPWYQGQVSSRTDPQPPIEPGCICTTALDEAYDWANFLAVRYAQLFRSGHVTNYVLAALAVVVALSGLIVPSVKIYLVMVELGVIGLLFYNTDKGSRGEWHRKWLQYRHLAESLRPLAYLKRTGLAGPPFRSDFAEQSIRAADSADWTRWYSAAVWREMPAPVGMITTETISKLASDVLDEQIEHQMAYHQVNAHRMHELDERLHEVGNFLVGAVIAACSLYIGIYFGYHEWIKPLTAPFVFVTAGFPAISAAAFGLRGHGEHLLAASRSASTVRALQINKERLEQINDINDLAAELRNTAEIMLSDLNEWAVSYRERALQVPG